MVVCVRQVTIGNTEHRCSCVRYVEDKTALIVGLPVGLALVVVIVVTTANILCRRRRRNTKGQAELSQGEVEMSTDQDRDIEDKQYSKQLPDDDDYVGDDYLHCKYNGVSTV